MSGHSDYSFATAWSPCGRFVVTGNQDLTTRIYDARKWSEPLCILASELAAIRSCQFNSSGSYLALAESVDYVHLVDMLTLSQEPQGQTIDFFGEVAGIAWSPDDSFFYIGTSDATYGSVLEFESSCRGDDWCLMDV